MAPLEKAMPLQVALLVAIVQLVLSDASSCLLTVVLYGRAAMKVKSYSFLSLAVVGHGRRQFLACVDAVVFVHDVSARRAAMRLRCLRFRSLSSVPTTFRSTIQ